MHMIVRESVTKNRAVKLVHSTGLQNLHHRPKRRLFERLHYWVFNHDPSVNQEKLLGDKPVPVPIRTDIMAEPNR